ncbi:MAG: hypothetical protein FWB93_04870 [Oscillospiraceae bacterium]|nr:hypothetical protein [Oscillospiraceae bacterium]
MVYELRFFFDSGGACVWTKNENAREKFGCYPIENNTLPISVSLVDELNALVEEYATSIDWDYPPAPSPWTEEQKKEFSEKVNLAYVKLCKELGQDYIVINEFCEVE